MSKNTRQREAIREVFERTTRPLGPKDVLAAAQRALPGLGIATVYRNLKLLEEEGSLKAVHLPGDVQLYERADQMHHHFFHCRRCNRYFDIQACPGDFDRLVPQGYKLEAHELMLSGLCDTCASSQSAKKD
ncbi:transcriptional repressor [Candidatus Sumerlaeota bacterium]|nr:transcriptional repressor [Candidatus Sumerlaeota bacterium]